LFGFLIISLLFLYYSSITTFLSTIRIILQLNCFCNPLKNLFYLFLVLICTKAAAQPNDTAYNTRRPQISYAVLPNKGYTLQQVINDSLPFIPGDSLRPAANAFYWLKITFNNPVKFAGKYALKINPSILNTFYYFDANAKDWVASVSGIQSGAGNGVSEGFAPNLVMQAQAVNTVYVKMEVAKLKQYGVAVKPRVSFLKQDGVDKRKIILLAGWLIALSVLLFFFLSNLYVYFSLKDRSVLHYLIGQVGGMIYITTYWELAQGPLFTTTLVDDVVRYYNLNTLLMHAGILLIIYGFVQLTRSYLNTGVYLKKLDALLKYGLYIYCVASVVLAIVNTCWFFAEDDTIIYDNIYLLLLMLLIVYTGIRAYRLKLRASGTFLLANLVPLLLMIGIALFHVLISTNGLQNLWLPNLAVVSQAFVFSIALVARTRLIQQDLKIKEMEAQQLAFELKEIDVLHKLAELENQKMAGDILQEKTRNELLHRTLESNQRELASVTLYMVQKNELLATVKAEIAELKKLNPGQQKTDVSGMERILRTNLYLDEDWEKFRVHFEQVHPGFFNDLAARHPSLTKNEIRLHTYFHINLSVKEISALLNITPASVRTAKMRLAKKMGDTTVPYTDEAF